MRIGIQITKSVLFRNVQQEFHNVYYYELITAITANSASLANELVATEKSLHSTDVKFLRTAVWTAGGDINSNAMLYRGYLTGTGDQQTNPDMDRERAILIRWPSGYSITGKPVYLRKWYHSCGNAAGQSMIVAGLLQNTSGFLQATRDAIASKADEVRSLGATENWNLCSKSGRYANQGAEAHKYLEHHQLGDKWRV